MISLAIEILWFLIGVIILGGVIWIALYILHQVFANLPPIVDRVVWGVFGILCLIYVLMMISGQAPSFRPRLTGQTYLPAFADAGARGARYLSHLWTIA